MKNREVSLPSSQAVERASLQSELELNAEKCFECKLCVRECAFLQKYGTPKQIAEEFDPAGHTGSNIGFECSLCGLCGAVCPAALDPAAMFLEMRRESVDRGLADIRRYNRLLNYEKRGTSKLFSWYGLPENCRTVLFPGCALAGSRPATVRKLYGHLQGVHPDLGIVFDCCSKPSHDLGQEKMFHNLFDEMKTFLASRGIEKILVACPSCWQMFNDYGGALKVETVYEHLSGSPLSAMAGEVEATVHDACVTRDQPEIHRAVRKLGAESSLNIQEMDHRGMKTFCCGEGGAVQYANPEYSGKWTEKRVGEARGRMIVTYCAGCSHFLGRAGSAHHILDLFFYRDKAKSGRMKAAKAPFTYLNRLRLKAYFRKKIVRGVSWERGALNPDGDRSFSGTP